MRRWPTPCLMLITDRTRLRGRPLEEVASQARARVGERGLAAFASFERAAAALRRAIDYWRQQEGLD